MKEELSGDELRLAGESQILSKLRLFRLSVAGLTGNGDEHMSASSAAADGKKENSICEELFAGLH